MTQQDTITINGQWSDTDNAWVSEVIELTGSIYLEISLNEKGRCVIKKSNTIEGPWPKALISSWTGPDFKIRVLPSTDRQYIKIYLTSEPNNIHYAYI